MEVLHQILGEDLNMAFFVIFNLIIIESLLSVDNAAVLATMVMDLPAEQRAKALRYGIIGAYVFRGICLLLAAWLVKIWWLKPLGGLYLLWLAYNFFTSRETPTREDDTLNKEEKWFYRVTIGRIGKFWATVVAVEMMDLAFSLDNVFAAVAFTDNINLIYIGVFIGILAMRFVAQFFVQLMEKYPFLEGISFFVIGLLGLKLLASLPTHFYPNSLFTQIMDSHHTDMFISIFTALCFFVPIVTARLFNFPKVAVKK